jgi:type I restriction enzyme, S subunit
VKIERLLTGRDKSHVQKASADIPSIPEVPSSWQLRRNKTFLHEVNKPSINGQEELLSVSHLTGATSSSLKEVNMFMAESLEGYKTVSVGDLVINTMWAWMGAAGTSSIEGIVSPAYGVYRFDQSTMLPQFFDSLVRTRAYIDEMTRFSKGVWSSRLRLYPDEFLRLSSPAPPLSEQRQIVNNVSVIRQATSRSCAVLRKEVELLQERRQALITAVVTGEMDVPGVPA